VFERQVAPQALGKYTWTCVWGFRAACYEALQRAEELKGSPPFVVDILKSWNSVIPYLTPFFI